MKDSKKTNQPLFTEKDIISSYSRAEAIVDGVLTDVSELAKQTGFKYPVAISEGIAALISEACNQTCFDFNGIVWDILNVLFYEIKRSKSHSNILHFSILMWDKYQGKVVNTKMYSLVGPGDQAEPVITIMLPTED